MNREQITEVFLTAFHRGKRSPIGVTANLVARDLGVDPKARAHVVRNIIRVMHDCWQNGVADDVSVSNAVADWFIDWATES